MDNLNNIENSQSTRLKHKYPEPKSNRKIVIVIVFVIIAIAIGSAGLFLFIQYSKTRQAYLKKQKYVSDIINSDSSTQTKSSIVDKYSQDYQKTLEATSDSNPSQWNKAKVDDAYATLLYVYKIGSYAQSLEYLALLDAAKNSGINIDDNSYGIDAKLREEIYNKSIQEANNALDKRGVSN